MILSSFIKNLNEINIYKENIKNNLFNLNDALNRNKIQIKKFKEAIEYIYLKYEEINIDYNIMISDFTKSNLSNLINLNKNVFKKLIDDYDFSSEFYFLTKFIINLIFLRIYKKEVILQINKTNKDDSFLNSSSWIKKIESIFNEIIKKYQVYGNLYENLLFLKKEMISSITGDIPILSKNEFGIILTQTLEEVSKQLGTFVLHKDYENRLKIYLNNITYDFQIPSWRNRFINDLNFSPKLSFESEEEILNDAFEIQPGWLLSFTDSGFFSLLNSRELKYSKILMNDLKIPRENIFYSDGIIFEI
jgi:hypothetical protein